MSTKSDLHESSSDGAYGIYAALSAHLMAMRTASLHEYVHVLYIGIHVHYIYIYIYMIYIHIHIFIYMYTLFLYCICTYIYILYMTIYMWLYANDCTYDYIHITNIITCFLAKLVVALKIIHWKICCSYEPSMLGHPRLWKPVLYIYIHTYTHDDICIYIYIHIWLLYDCSVYMCIYTLGFVFVLWFDWDTLLLGRCMS